MLLRLVIKVSCFFSYLIYLTSTVSAQLNHYVERIEIDTTGIYAATYTQILDIDTDGLNDLVYSGNGIWWHRNLGDGTFSDPYSISNYNGGSFVAADVDLDGDLEIMSAALQLFFNEDSLDNWNAENISFFLESGNPPILNDMNSDGLLDLVCRGQKTNGFYSSDIGVHIFLNSNDSIVFPGSEIGPPIIALDNDAFLRSADLNQDGLFDLLTLEQTGSEQKLKAHYNNGSLNFTTELIHTHVGSASKNLIVDDFNNDGTNDFLLSSDFDFKVLTTCADFSICDTVWLEATSRMTHSLDLFNDGFPELLSIDTDDVSSTGLAYYNNQNGTFNSSKSWLVNVETEIPQQIGAFTNVAIGHLNDDQCFDLAFSSSQVLDGFAICDTTFPYQSLELNAPYYPLSFEAFVPIDINADGLNDFLVKDNGNLIAYIQTDAGGFELIGLIAKNINGSQFYPYDLNEDGLVDVVYSNPSNGVSWLENIGSNQFESSENISFAKGSLSFADLDNDGIEEIIVSAQSQMYIVSKNNQFEFSNESVSLFLNPNRFESLTIDLNNDGFLDLLTFDQSEGLVYLLNDGTAQFPEIVPFDDNYAEANPQFSLRTNLIDLNQDGYEDLLLADLDNGTLYFYENSQQSSFLPRSAIIENLLSLDSFQFVDLQGDGLMDFMYRKNNGQVCFHMNRGDLQFDGPLCVQDGDVPLWSSQFLSLDLNFDGSPDLVTINQVSFSWFPNFSGLVPQASFEVDVCSLPIIENTSPTYLSEMDVLWIFEDGTTSNDINPEGFTFPTPGDYELSLSLCYGAECDTFTQVIDVTHSVDYNIPSTALPGETVLFQNNSFGYTNTSWALSNGDVSTDTHWEFTFLEPGNYQVELFITDSDMIDCTHHIVEFIEVLGPTGVESELLNEIFASPNPADKQVQIVVRNADQWDVSVFDMNGRLVHQAMVIGDVHSIDTAFLTEGLYLVKAQNAVRKLLPVKILINH